MGRKTRKASSVKKSKNITIPYLRRSFEYIEQFVNDKIHKKEKKESIIKELQKAWLHTFYVELNKTSAELYVQNRMKDYKSIHTLTKKHGGSMLNGAPLDYSLRPGEYLEQGNIPHNGHILSMNNQNSSYGSYVDYIYNGFTNPSIAQSHDPVPGQSIFPAQMGGRSKLRKVSNKARKIRKSGGGLGSFLDQAFERPIISSIPSSNLQNLQEYGYGKEITDLNPDQIQRNIHYKS